MCYKNIDIFTHVRVISFNGSMYKPADRYIRSCDDYWKLIGFEGIIIADEHMYRELFEVANTSRVLVKFDNDIKVIGLASHNAMDDSNWENSLWILVSDLEKIL
jgi:hypothetical protein